VSALIKKEIGPLARLVLTDQGFLLTRKVQFTNIQTFDEVGVLIKCGPVSLVRHSILYYMTHLIVASVLVKG